MSHPKRQTAKSEEEELPRVDETSRRIAGLLLLLGTSRSPVRTRDIVDDGDLGYGSGNRDSDMRKFRRDRETLARHGFHVREVAPAGGAENEESRWELDRARTQVDLPSLPLDDVLTLIHVIDASLSSPRAGDPLASPLSHVREKLAEAAFAASGRDGELGLGAPATRIAGEAPETAAAAALWSAFAARKAVPFSYRDAAGKTGERLVEAYGFFSLGGSSYLVGRDVAAEGTPVRTFNIARAANVRAPKGRYRIPDAFDISAYMRYPFDFSEKGGGAAGLDEAEKGSFLIPSYFAHGEVERITLGRGDMERQPGPDGDVVWSVPVRNTELAATFALREGIVPIDPPRLVEAWRNMVEKAVIAHGGKGQA